VTEEIKFDYNRFQSFVSNLKSSTLGINSSIKTNRTFEKTNSKPFIKDLEQVIRVIELLNRYQTSLHTDIETLEQIGEKIKERDIELAEQFNQTATNLFELRK